MGFGAVIASGEKNRILRDDLVDCIAEVRVEQSLDDLTRFAIRFQEDISGGEPLIMNADELQCEQMITIAVQMGDALRCLVRGPITDVKCSLKLGGPGSWYEIHGQDRRVELDRECFYRRWNGHASAAAEQILKGKFKTVLEATRRTYGGTEVQGRPTAETLNQRWTDLTFLRRIARQNNLHFWLEYACRPDPTDLSGRSLKVDETACLKPSPPRPKDEPAGPVTVDQIKLVPDVEFKLRVNVEKKQCPNVTAFDVSTNGERPTRFDGRAIDESDLREHRTSATDPQPAIRREGRRAAGCKEPRDVCITTAGNQEELHRKAEAALTEAGWFVNATASTTAHLLGGVLIPHEVVEVEGLGSVHSGPYQIKAVTHVINSADHFMDIQLRRNAIGGD